MLKVIESNLKNFKRIFSNKPIPDTSVKFIRTTWGLDVNKSNYKKIIKQDRKDGYSGYEIAYSFIDKEFLVDFNKELLENQMSLILQIHTSGESNEDHILSYKNQIKESVDLISSTVNHNKNQKLNLPIVNCHSSMDHFDIQSKTSFFLSALNDNKQNNINKDILISHETHRGRALNSPNEYMNVIKELSKTKEYQLNTTLDLSHWVLSYERLINKENLLNYEYIMENIENNTNLIHGRIGTENKIQIESPLDKEYSQYVNYYFKIWKRIIDLNKKKSKTTYMTIEYGPQPYSNSAKEARFYARNSKKIIDFYSDRLENYDKWCF